MQRLPIQPRDKWPSIIESQGLFYHRNPDGDSYWKEDAYYLFTTGQIDELDEAADELHQMCLAAVQHVIDNDRFSELGIPAEAIPLIKRSWARKDPTVYGRFDLSYDGVNPPKLLEYNADTPVALIEAAAIQWFWLQDTFGGDGQFNTIYEKLLETWQKVFARWDPGSKLFLACYGGNQEDLVTVSYLADTVIDSGIKPELAEVIFLQDIGLGDNLKRFTDLHDLTIENVFKLYPWEWLLAEQFAPYLIKTFDEMNWIEPIWKMILSSKGILPILWELNPGHPNLLPAYFDGPRDMKDYVRKPLFSREGANISLYRDGKEESRTEGAYGEEGYIFQERADIPCFDGWYPICGCWIIGGHSAGMGIRESQSLITGGLSPFVPHRFE